MKRSLLLCLSFIVLLTASLLHAAKTVEQSEPEIARQEILILNSYHPGFAWSDDEQAGIIDVFRGKDKNWLPVIEYLDLKRLPDGRHLAELKKLLRRKYQNQKVSVVIAMDNPALEFATDNQAELFGNAPIVFCGINNYTPSLLKGRSDVTGIVEAIDLVGTIEVMLRLHPATREIFVPHDYTVTGLAARKEIEALIPRFGARVRFRFTDPLTMEELLKELERLPGDSLVLPISFITDKSGRTFGMTEATRLFYEHSSAPIYSPYEQRLGFGIVGGKLLSARIHGTDAARIALRVLAGEKASAIPVVLESDSKFMFDYKVMSRFGIPLSALPEGSTVINKPVSFYAAHRVVIQTALGVIVFMAVVISLLTINIIQIALRRSEENFRHSLDDSPMKVRIVTIEGETIYANRAILDIYGYDSVEELRTTPVKNRYTPQSYAEFKIRREKRKGDVDVPSGYEISIVRKNGEIRHLQVLRKDVLWDGERQFQVIYQDITDRKRAEEKLRASQQQLRALAERLQQIREEERVLVSREIHDVIGGGLTGLKMDLSWLIHNVKNAESDEGQAAFKSKMLISSEFVDQMIKDTRRISTGLRPPFIDDLGLISAIDWQLSELTGRTGILHELTTQFEYINMEKDKAVAVFRIFQETLTNIIRHSGATKVVVILREDDERSLFGDENLVLEIRDNGRGITGEEILDSKSLGLLGMKERAMVFGGEFSIRGEPGGGTTIVLKIPRKKGEAS
ncbi:MAG: PAS domain S-box protein [Pseudomonadota bacterium]